MSSLIPPLALLCIASLALPRGGAAQSLVAAPVVEGTTTVTGTVRWAGVSGVTVDTDGNQRLMFDLDSSSRVSGPLHVGDAVRVSYHTRGTGRHVARIAPLHTAQARQSAYDESPDRVRGTPVSYAMTSAGPRPPAEPAVAASVTPPEPTDVTPPATPSTAVTDEPPASTPSSTLPATAGSDPLLALLGGLALGAGVGIGWVGTRRG